MKFTHANRHCPDHPYEALKRNDDDIVFNAQPEEQSIEILKWLQKYREERQQFLLQQTLSPSTSRKTPKRPSTSSSSRGNEENKRRVFGKSLIEDGSDHNCDTTDQNMPKTIVRSKGLMCEMDLNVVQSSTPVQHHYPQDGSEISSVMASPISTNKQKYCRPKIILWKEPIDANDDDEMVTINENELKDNQSSCNNTIVSSNSCTTSSSSSPVKKMLNPKKKWLRQSEAWQEQDLARPLDYGTNHPLYHSDRNWQMTSNIDFNISSSSPPLLNPNQSRPSVLIMAKDKFD